MLAAICVVSQFSNWLKYSSISRIDYFNRSIYELTDNFRQFVNWLDLTNLFHKLPKTKPGNLRNYLFVVFTTLLGLHSRWECLYIVYDGAKSIFGICFEIRHLESPLEPPQIRNASKIHVLYGYIGFRWCSIHFRDQFWNTTFRGIWNSDGTDIRIRTNSSHPQ